MTRSVATFAKVEMVTDSMLCTAEHRCPSMFQLPEIGLHQKAIRHMCKMKVARVKMEAHQRTMRMRLPCRLKSE